MSSPKIILGIETSCDETACAIVKKDGNRVKLLSNVVASSADLQAKYGGVIPEQAAREQLKSIIPVIKEALRLASLAQGKQSLDAIAVTQGPGLIGSLLVGVETAKVLATVWQKPLVPVNHLIGHFYGNWIVEDRSKVKARKPVWKKGKDISEKTNFQLPNPNWLPNPNPISIPKFPAIGLLVSGGHTDLILMTAHGKYKYLGGTRDDAAGEAFDKTARLLGLPYPGGPVIAKLAEEGNPQAFKLPRPMIDSDDLDFSFSGLKTSVSNIVGRLSEGKNNKLLTVDDKQNLSASIQEAIIDVLVAKTLRAAQTYKVEQILVAGGVAANRKLREKFEAAIQKKISHVRLFIPPPKLCTDNAAYIATAAFYNYHPTDPLTLQANPNLSLSS